ncbi:hypothetical protein ACWDBD_17535 [Streptomyces sp. NPDC001118]
MLIPIHKGGTWATPGPVVAYAQVDASDFEELSRHRWRLNAHGYAARTSQRATPSVCPECGWTPRPGVRVANSVANHRSKMHQVPLEKRYTILMHRVILDLEAFDPREGDHRNRDRLDNRRSNLRITAGKLQVQNQGSLKTYKGKAVESKYRGVYKVKKKGKWTGRWKAVAAQHYLGCFASEEEAAAVAAEYRLKTMPYALD